MLTKDVFTYYEGKARRRVCLSLRGIVRFRGDGNYTWLYALNQTPYLLSRTLTEYEDALPGFVRINKADLINPLFIASVGYTVGDDPLQRRVIIRLTTGEELICSRRRGLPLIRTLYFPFDSF